MAKRLSEDEIKWILSVESDEAQQSIRKLTKENQELTKTNRDTRKSMQDLIAQGKKGSQEYKNFEKAIKENNAAIDKNKQTINALTDKMNVNQLTMGQLRKRASDLRKQLDSTAKGTHPEEYAKLTKELKHTTQRMDQLRDSGHKVKSMFSAANVSRGIFVAGLAAFLATFKNATSVIIDFEKANADLAAILQTNRKNIQELTKDALRLGETTKYTASEVTGLQIELAKLGFNNKEILEATEFVLLFADAAGVGLPEAAKLAGASLRAFGLDTSETERVVSTLAVATTKTAMDFSFLETSMSTIAPVAKSFGFTIEDTAALLGLLSNSGFDASSAATATRNILLGLADSSGSLAVALGKPVNSLEDLVDGLLNLNDQGVDLAKTLELTDKRSVAAFNTFLDGADSLIPLRDSVTDAGEAMRVMSEEKLNTVDGSIKILQSTIEGLILKFYESNGMMKLIIDTLTKIVSSVSWCIEKFTQFRAITIPLTATILAYVTSVKLATVWTQRKTAGTIAHTIAEKANAVAMGISTAAIKAKNLVTGLLTGQVTLAAAATRIFNAALMANPIVAVTTVLIGLASAVYTFTTRASDAVKASRKLNEELQTGTLKVDELFKALKKTNPATEERKKLIEQFNELYPGLLQNYDLENAKTEELGKLQKEVNTELKNTIALKLKNEQIGEIGDKYVKKQLDQIEEISHVVSILTKKKFKDIEKELVEMLWDPSKSGEDINKFLKETTGQTFALQRSVEKIRKNQNKYNEDIERTTMLYDAMLEPINKIGSQTKTNAIEETSLIKKLEKQKAEVQEKWKEDTEENIKLKNQELARIDKEIDKLKKLGVVKEDKNPNATRLKNMEADHKEEINLIRLTGLEKQQLQEEINLSILTSDKKYYKDRIKELDKFVKKETNPARLAEYVKLRSETKAQLLNTEISLEKQSIATIEKLREKELAKEAQTTQIQRTTYNKSLAEKKITKDEYDLLMISLDKTSTEMRLAIEEQYLNDINDLELKNGQLKADAVKKANQAVMNAEENAAKSRATQQEKLDDILKDFKGKFDITTPEEDLKLQLKVLEDFYKARKELAEKNNLDIAELDAAYQKAKERIIRDSEERIAQLRQQYGISTQKEIFEQELELLKQHLEEKRLTEEEYQKAVTGLKRDFYKQQFDYYASLFGDAMSALQQAELDRIDAKYDVEIEAAKGNAEEVERLEHEKAEKKLDIQKKYADVNFAMKVSQIIADTAVAIMKAYADLGPIGGAISAGLLSATGIAQMASAKAERDKIKNMTLSGTSSGSTQTGSRIATGRESGGKIDITRAQDGKFFPATDYDPDARGFIDKPTVIVGEGPTGHSKEWVASNAAVENPTIAPILSILDKHQQAGDIATIDMNHILRQRTAAGFVSGGSISTPISKTTPSTAPAPVPQDYSEFKEAVSAFKEATDYLKDHGVTMALTEMERSMKLRDRSRSIGSKR